MGTYAWRERWVHIPGDRDGWVWTGGAAVVVCWLGTVVAISGLQKKINWDFFLSK